MYNIASTTVYTREHVALVLSAPPPNAGALRKLARFVLCPLGVDQSRLKHARLRSAPVRAKRTSTGRSSPYRSLCITLSSSAYFDSHVLLCKIWNIGNYFLRYIVYHNYKFHCVSRVTFLSCRNPGMINYHIKDGRAVGYSRRNPRLRRGRLFFVRLVLHNHPMVLQRRFL